MNQSMAIQIMNRGLWVQYTFT